MRVCLVVLLATAAAACGSKTGIGSLAVGVDTATPDTGEVDGGFDTFPCRWSYSQPTVVARGFGEGAIGGLGGATHGRLDTVWVHAEDLTMGDGRISQRLSLGDPPPLRTEPPAPLVPNLELHGLVDGWASLAGDCSLGFFDDDTRPRRLVVAALAAPPCRLERLDTEHIDVTFPSPRSGRVVRYDMGGAVVHDVSSAADGELHAVTSPDGSRLITFARSSETNQVMSELWSAATGERIGIALNVGESIGGLSTSVDRLRPAALALLSGRGTTTLIRLPFDDEGEVTTLITTSDGSLDPNDALVTNETEALMVLTGGLIAIQPLSGSALRFLEPPEVTGRVDDLKIILAPGQSRGGALMSHTTEDGESLLEFRTMVCNR